MIKTKVPSHIWIRNPYRSNVILMSAERQIFLRLEENRSSFHWQSGGGGGDFTRYQGLYFEKTKKFYKN